MKGHETQQKQQREGETHSANGAFKLGAGKFSRQPSIGENSNVLVTAGSLGDLEPSEKNSVSNTSHPPSSTILS